LVSGVIIKEAVETGIAVAQGGQTVSRHFMGYDFVGLVTRLLVFYIVALVIAKIMEIIVFAQDGIGRVTGLFGIPLPSTVPEPIRKLFVEGYVMGGMTIKWWDLIKIVSVMIVITEWLSFEADLKSTGRKSATSTKAVFFLIIGALLLISVPQLKQMMTESKITGIVN